MVRIGEHDDIDDILSMSCEFWKHTIYDDPIDPETIEEMAKGCINNGLMAVLEIDGGVYGFACGLKGALLGNCHIPVGIEVAWWVDPEHRSGRNGISLLLKLEQLAKDKNIKYWNMAYMESSMPREVAQIYEKMGYKKTEVIYSKELSYGSNNSSSSNRRSRG